MRIWTITCLIFAAFFGILGVIFALLKEKGAILISGFNTLSKEEREKYDKKKMSIDMRNSFFLWFGILFLGAALSYFSSNVFAMIAIVIWIILFFKDVHLDLEKAFGKYKKHDS
ncbi:DUF3784 domain-containing protein [uncultured Clostridium sp.]|uniref:DUF3784 domain-containing protein n=1 Tax=uncultured Clostridium sp. TaxID=59620 RepID=UPI0028E19E79|nr:DUF3784 domain-containing protein [uncultured Clostridium sp.]